MEPDRFGDHVGGKTVAGVAQTGAGLYAGLPSGFLIAVLGHRL